MEIYFQTTSSEREVAWE